MRAFFVAREYDSDTRQSGNCGVAPRWDVRANAMLSLSQKPARQARKRLKMSQSGVVAHVTNGV